MNLNAYNKTNNGKYALRTYRGVFDYGNCGQLADYYCTADNLEDAIAEINQLVEQYNTDSEFNGGLIISPRWISKRHENGNSSCCYEFK